MGLKKYFVILIVTGFLLYLPSLFGQFAWDDEDFVYANKYVETCQIDKFFTDSVTAGRGKVSNYYRPVQLTVYCLLHSVVGFNPFWYHLVNILVHIAAACAIFYFLCLAFGNSPLSFLISILFLIHPVQTEAVSYVSGLSDPLYVLFGFLSLITLIYTKEKTNEHKYFFLSLLFFLLSILSKETGLVFVGLIILVQFAMSLRVHKVHAAIGGIDGLLRPSLRFVLAMTAGVWPYMLITCLYLLFHVTNINQMDMKAVWGNGPYANNLFIRLATFAQNIPVYIGLLIFPRDLFMERDFSTRIATNIFLPLVTFALTNILVFALILKLQLQLKLQLLFFYFAFWISFIPYSGIVLINGIFYEHFLYLPLVFFFGFIVVIARSAYDEAIRRYRLPRSLQSLAMTVLVIIVGLLIVRNFFRQMEWNDNIRFYTQTLAHAPKSIRIINGLGMEYANRGNLAMAIKNYELGIRNDTKVPNLYHNLANAYAAKGDVVNAEKYYLEAIKVDPNFSFSYYSLLNLYLQTGQKEKVKVFLPLFKNKFPDDSQISQLELQLQKD